MLSPPFISQVVFSVLAVSVQSAPQLLYGGYAGYPYAAAHTVHAVPTVAKHTVNYKTAAFEPVDAATPADAQLIELKETDHSYDVLVPGPTKYVSTPVAYPHAYGKSVQSVVWPALYLPAAPGYAGLGLPYYGLPVAATAAAEAEE